MRSTWRRRLGVVAAVAVGLGAAGGIAYAAIPSSGGAVRGPTSTPHVFLVGGSGAVAVGPHFSARVGLGSIGTTEAAVPMPESGTLGHLHAAVAPNATSPGVSVAISVNGTQTSITCTIGPGRRRCSDKTHTAAFNEGDQVDAWVTNGTGSDVYVSWAVRAG